MRLVQINKVSCVSKLPRNRDIAELCHVSVRTVGTCLEWESWNVQKPTDVNHPTSGTGTNVENFLWVMDRGKVRLVVEQYFQQFIL
jgi:hypothetical protein